MLLHIPASDGARKVLRTVPFTRSACGSVYGRAQFAADVRHVTCPVCLTTLEAPPASPRTTPVTPKPGSEPVKPEVLVSKPEAEKPETRKPRMPPPLAKAGARRPEPASVESTGPEKATLPVPDLSRLPDLFARLSSLERLTGPPSGTPFMERIAMISSEIGDENAFVLGELTEILRVLGAPALADRILSLVSRDCTKPDPDPAKKPVTSKNTPATTKTPTKVQATTKAPTKMPATTKMPTTTKAPDETKTPDEKTEENGTGIRAG